MSTTAHQDKQALVESVRRRFAEWFPRSYEHHLKAREVVPRGAARNRLWWPFAAYIVKGEGPYVHDLDGNRLIDCNLGFGSAILGHDHPELMSAIKEQLGRGLLPGSVSPHEESLARKLVDNVPGADWIGFAVSGTEATLGAIRIARAATGRKKVAKFEGGWHGWHDFLLFSVWRFEGSPEAPKPLPDQ